MAFGDLLKTAGDLLDSAKNLAADKLEDLKEVAEAKADELGLDDLKDRAMDKLGDLKDFAEEKTGVDLDSIGDKIGGLKDAAEAKIGDLMGGNKAES
jgi:hypothetical protein